MTYRLPHVLVMFNLICRPVLLPGEASRRAFVRRSLPSYLPRVLSLFHLPVPPLYPLGGTAWRWASAACDCDGHAAVVRLRVPRFAYAPPILPIAPLHRHGWRGGERMASLLASFGFLPSAAFVSVWDSGGCLLACSYAVGRFRSAVCCARILWIAFVAVAGAALPWYIVIVS